MSQRLSQPCEGSVVKSPKHKPHGTPVGVLVNEDTARALEAIRRGEK